MQDGIFQATPLMTIGDLSSACWHKRLLIKVATFINKGRNIYYRGRDVYCNRCCNHRVGELTWRQILLIEVVTVALTWRQQ